MAWLHRAGLVARTPGAVSVTGHSRTPMPAAGTLTKLISLSTLPDAPCMRQRFVHHHSMCRVDCGTLGHALHSARYQILAVGGTML
jgi:hypothetical protein